MLTINGGKGKYVGGFAGAPAMNVLILGGGVVGENALKVLYALGANCTVMDINIGVLRRLSTQYPGISTMMSSKENIAAILPNMDLVLNCVKWPKHRKDFLIDKEMLKTMEPGSVLVDISNDNPGAIESSRPTAHENPRYVVNGVVHYCVDNIPSATAQSTSQAYAAVMLPFILSILNDGVVETLRAGWLLEEKPDCVQRVPDTRGNQRYPGKALGQARRTAWYRRPSGPGLCTAGNHYPFR